MIEAVIAHQVPGRIRIRIPTMRGQAHDLTELAGQLGNIAGVAAVKLNSATGSIVLQFSGNADSILESMRELGLNPVLKQDIDQAVRNSGIRPFRLVSGREINPMFMVGSALAIVGLVQTFRGKIVVPSVTAFWYALEAFRASANDADR